MADQPLTDNQVIDVLATALEAASAQITANLAAASPPVTWSAVVLQKDQPTLQGAPTGPAVYFEKLFDQEYGWQFAKYTHNAPVAPAVQGTFTQTETQWTETTFQVSAQAIQDPEVLSVPTASDIVNYMKLYINSRANQAYFKAQGVAGLRITNIRNPAFKDDRDVFEFNPNFDVVLQYLRQMTATVPATNIVQGATVEGFEGQGTFPV
jgi:hypothetical protein